WTWTSSSPARCSRWRSARCLPRSPTPWWMPSSSGPGRSMVEAEAGGGFRVEVAYARQDVQALVAVDVPPGARLIDAVALSGLLQRFPEIDPERLDAGIFGR